MDWRVDFAPSAERDFRIIVEHLTRAYVTLGDAPPSAAARAVDRARRLRATADRLARAPGMGAARPDVG